MQAHAAGNRGQALKRLHEIGKGVEVLGQNHHGAGLERIQHAGRRQALGTFVQDRNFSPGIFCPASQGSEPGCVVARMDPGLDEGAGRVVDHPVQPGLHVPGTHRPPVLDPGECALAVAHQALDKVSQVALPCTGGQGLTQQLSRIVGQAANVLPD